MEDLIDSVKNFFGNKFNVRFIQACKRESKNGSQKARLLVLTDFRMFFLLRSPICVEKYFHIIDIKCLESLTPDKLSITSSSKTVVVVAESGFLETVKEILYCLKRIYCSLPAKSLIQKLIMPSQQIIDEIFHEVDQIKLDILPCGNFSVAYRCMCDLFSYPCLEDVVWDVEAIYYLHDSKEFNFRDFDYLETKYHIPILCALQHNSYFTGLNFSNVKLVQQNVTELAKILRNNKTLKCLILSNTSMKTNHLEKFCEAISLNQNSAISVLEISRNNLDEKGIACLSSLSLSWRGLAFVETSLSQSALINLFTALSENDLNFVTLTHLDLSRNVFKKDASTALFSFLSHPNSIEQLILEQCEVPLELCFDQLRQGCTKHLRELNLTGSQVSRKRLNEGVLFKWKEFFSSSQSLRVVTLNHCHLIPEALKSVFLGLAVNKFVKEVEIKLAGNSFDLKSLDVFEVCLPLLTNVISLDISNNNFIPDDFKILFEKLGQMKKLKKLYIGRNLQNSKSKTVEIAVEAIVNYLKAEDLALECLHMEDMNLKSECHLFLNHLGGDSHLVELNISVCLLSKALQINCKLKRISMDRNDLNIQSLHDIAHALSRNYFLTKISLPFHDITSIQKANPDKLDKLEEVLKKIEDFISRNNSPSMLLLEKSCASKIDASQTPHLEDLVQASKYLQDAIDEVPGSLRLQNKDLIDDAKSLLEESLLFVKTYSNYYKILENEYCYDNSPTLDRQLTKLIMKLRNSGSAYQTESIQDLVQYLAKTSPKNFELMKEKMNFNEVKLHEVIISPILAKIIEDTEQTLNVTVPHAGLELLKMVSELLTSNIKDLLGNLERVFKESKYEEDGISRICNIRDNSAYIKNRRSTLKEEIRGLSESLMDNFMKTPRTTRPTSSFIEHPILLNLPTLSESLEHLNLQRPKPAKNHKPTMAIPKLTKESTEPMKPVKPPPRKLPPKETNDQLSKDLSRYNSNP